MRGAILKPIVIAAGGTGGHLYPAEALADALQSRGLRVVLMTDARSTAAASPVFAACERHVVEGAGLAGRGPVRIASGLRQLARGTSTARRLLTRLNAAALIGFGGYPSVPPVLATIGLRARPVVILHDQNAVLGRANRLLARFASHLALSFEPTAGIPSRIATTLTGNPIRPAVLAHAGAPYAPATGTIRLLVLGGSLGARIFATLIPQALFLLPEAPRRRITLVMQCPAAEIAGAQAMLTAAGTGHELAPFFADVGKRLAAAHLVIARAGGSTVAELAVVGRPSILIPLAINDDQRHNADMLARAGAAIRLDQVTTTPAILARAIETLFDSPDHLSLMAQAAARVAIPDATTRLAGLVESLAVTESAR